MKAILSHLLMLVIGLAIGHFLIPKQATTPTKPKPTSTEIAADTTLVDSTQQVVQVDTVNMDEDVQEAETTSTTPNDDKPTTAVIPVPTSVGPSFCEGNPKAMELHLSAFSAAIEADSIWYKSEPLSDCSGMFHRVLKSVHAQCPNAVYPAPEDARSSRGLAKWFHDNGRLTIINDAKTAGHMLRPGAILFFGSSGVKYTNPTIDILANSGGVQHISVVTAIDEDDAGIVQGYTMFHGRSTGKIASRTKGNPLQPKRDLPPYGNWKQELVAVAYLK